MTPLDIINRMANISLNEDTPDSETQARIMRYINDAYFETYWEIAKLYKSTLLTSETVTITNGVGTLSTQPFSIEQVKDNGEDFVLEASDIEFIERIDEELDDTGDPLRYYITNGTTIGTHPINNTTILVRYIPNPTKLSVSGVETDIKLPIAFHQILVWGGLFYLFLDERDTRTTEEIAAARNRYESNLTRLKTYLRNDTRQRIRVQGQFF